MRGHVRRGPASTPRRLVLHQRITRKGVKRPLRALTVPQLRRLRVALRYDERAIGCDVPDLVSFLMATGLRTGEACGLARSAVDLGIGTIDVRATVVRVRGLVVKPTKTDAGTRNLVQPSWCGDCCTNARPALPPSTKSTMTGR